MFKNDYDSLALFDINEVESMGGKYNPEMRLIGKRLRKDIWRLGDNNNSMPLHQILSSINWVYKFASETFGEDIWWNQSTVVEYVAQLAKYKSFLV